MPYKTHITFFFYVNLAPPPQNAKIKGSRKGKKGETHLSAKTDDSEEG